MFQILALYLKFEHAKNICPLSPDVGFGGSGRFPTVVWNIDLDSKVNIGL